MTPPEIPEQVQRWTAKRRVGLVLNLLKSEKSAQKAAPAIRDGVHGVVAEINRMVDGLQGGCSGSSREWKRFIYQER